MKATASVSGQISFYSDIPEPIGDPNLPNILSVRPATIIMFADGSWVINKLRWTGWGTSVAHATGVDSESTGVPNVATAPRVNRPAKVALSHPEVVLGHRVYGCFRLTVPTAAKVDQLDCIKHTKAGWYYQRVVKPTTPASAPKSKHVRFYTPTRNIFCGMFDDGSSQSGVTCEMFRPPALASVFANGRVLIRRGAREVGNPGEGDLRSYHRLPYGSSATAGRFRCKSAFTGVTCVVIKTGKGFFISKQSVRAVG